MRRAAREITFKFIFEYLFLHEKRDLSTLTAASVEQLDENDIIYVNTVYDGVIEKYDDIMARIAKHSGSFKPERIYKIDLAILILAVYEIAYMSDIPYGATANEAVELAKIYSTENSGGYVNGLLSSIIKEVSTECQQK